MQNQFDENFDIENNDEELEVKKIDSKYERPIVLKNATEEIVRNTKGYHQSNPEDGELDDETNCDALLFKLLEGRDADIDEMEQYEANQEVIDDEGNRELTEEDIKERLRERAKKVSLLMQKVEPELKKLSEDISRFNSAARLSNVVQKYIHSIRSGLNDRSAADTIVVQLLPAIAVDKTQNIASALASATRYNKVKDSDATAHGVKEVGNFVGTTVNPMPIPRALSQKVLNGDPVVHVLKVSQHDGEHLTLKGMMYSMTKNKVARDRGFLEINMIEEVNEVKIGPTIKRKNVNPARPVDQVPFLQIDRITLNRVIESILTREKTSSDERIFAEVREKIMAVDVDFDQRGVDGQIMAITQAAHERTRTFLNNGNVTQLEVRHLRHLFHRYKMVHVFLKDNDVETIRRKETIVDEKRTKIEVIYNECFRCGGSTNDFLRLCRDNHAMISSRERGSLKPPIGPGVNFQCITNPESRTLGLDMRVAIGGGSIFFETEALDLKIEKAKKYDVEYKVFVTSEVETIKYYGKRGGTAIIKIRHGMIAEGIIFAAEARKAERLYREIRCALGDLNSRHHDQDWRDQRPDSLHSLLKGCVPLYDTDIQTYGGRGFYNGKPNHAKQNDIIRWVNEDTYATPALVMMSYDENLGICKTSIMQEYLAQGRKPPFHRCMPITQIHLNLVNLRRVLPIHKTAEEFVDFTMYTLNTLGRRNIARLMTSMDPKALSEPIICRFLDFNKSDNVDERKAMALTLLHTCSSIEKMLILLPFVGCPDGILPVSDPDITDSIFHTSFGSFQFGSRSMAIEFQRGSVVFKFPRSPGSTYRKIITRKYNEIRDQPEKLRGYFQRPEDAIQVEQPARNSSEIDDMEELSDLEIQSVSSTSSYTDKRKTDKLRQKILKKTKENKKQTVGLNLTDRKKHRKREKREKEMKVIKTNPLELTTESGILTTSEEITVVGSAEKTDIDTIIEAGEMEEIYAQPTSVIPTQYPAANKMVMKMTLERFKNFRKNREYSRQQRKEGNKPVVFSEIKLTELQDKVQEGIDELDEIRENLAEIRPEEKNDIREALLTSAKDFDEKREQMVKEGELINQMKIKRGNKDLSSSDLEELKRMREGLISKRRRLIASRDIERRLEDREAVVFRDGKPFLTTDSMVDTQLYIHGSTFPYNSRTTTLRLQSFKVPVTERRAVRRIEKKMKSHREFRRKQAKLGKPLGPEPKKESDLELKLQNVTLEEIRKHRKGRLARIPMSRMTEDQLRIQLESKSKKNNNLLTYLNYLGKDVKVFGVDGDSKLIGDDTSHGDNDSVEGSSKPAKGQKFFSKQIYPGK